MLIISISGLKDIWINQAGSSAGLVEEHGLSAQQGQRWIATMGVGSLGSSGNSIGRLLRRDLHLANVEVDPLPGDRVFAQAVANRDSERVTARRRFGGEPEGPRDGLGGGVLDPQPFDATSRR